jgi:hypothetical protein
MKKMGGYQTIFYSFFFYLKKAKRRRIGELKKYNNSTNKQQLHCNSIKFEGNSKPILSIGDNQ